MRSTGAARRSAATLTGLLLATITFVAPARQTAPDWTLDSATGEPINLYSHSAGRPAALLFRATWCPYCRKHMPFLATVRREFADADVVFYTLNIREDGDPVGYRRERRYGFDLLLDADPVAVRRKFTSGS